MRGTIIFSGLILLVSSFAAGADDTSELPSVQLGPRPFYLVEQMEEGPLKTKLQSCADGPFLQSDFSIAHRGAPLVFPEHSRESYLAAARMGAGLIECDVTFTADLELVCRHSQSDLATTTNILGTPLAATCVEPFSPATFHPDGSLDRPASATCRTSDLTLEEFLSLEAKMEASNPEATSPEEFMQGTPRWRTDLFASGGTLMSHAQSIELFKSLGVGFIPELKAPEVEMPFVSPVTGAVFSREDFAAKLIDEYRSAGVSPNDVHPQSFYPADLGYWLKATPEFGANAILLDGRRYNPQSPADENLPSLEQIAGMGVTTIAPPLWVLLKEENGRIVPSDYALSAKEANLSIITWTLERSGRIREDVVQGTSKYFFQSVLDALKDDGDIYKVLDVLARQVGVEGVFSDWPATVTYYANCMKL
ncbi:MAG: glycerophosphodiester phosphodiesterase family protein [Paracoccaceae bacterium]|nr:glycerophosphodiester phosphodiesterase family protein [Paracoccaceae bacterium]